MASKGISIPIASETRDFSVGIAKGVIGPLDDVVNVLGDVARAGEKGGDKLERSLEDAQREAESLKGEYRELSRVIEAEAQKGARATKTNTAEATSAARRNVQELSGEAKQNLAETLSSFDGSVESFVAGVQGTLGGVTAGLTGVGATILAVAGAAGLGLIYTAIQEGGVEAEKLRAKIGELAAEFIETGEIAEASVGYIVDNLKELATASEDGTTSLKDLAKAADGSGSSFRDLAQAYAGNTEDLDKLVESSQKLFDSLEEQAFATDTTTNAGIAARKELLERSVAQEQYTAYLTEAKTVADEAALAAENYARSGAAELERKAELVESVNAAYDETAASLDEYINAETGVFDTAAYITAMQEREQALKNYQDTLTKSGLTPAAQSFLNDQGADAAAAFLTGYQAATPAQQAELNRIWTEAGSANSATYRDKLAQGFGKTPVKGPTVTVDADTSSADTKIANLVGRGLSKTLTLNIKDKYGRALD